MFICILFRENKFSVSKGTPSRNNRDVIELEARAVKGNDISFFSSGSVIPSC